MQTVWLFLMRVIAFAAGAALVLGTLKSAIVTFVLPRSAPTRLTRSVFRLVRRVFDLQLKRSETYEERDRIMAMYAPVALMFLLPAWYLLVLIGFTGMFWAIGIEPLERAFKLSGSSLLTLGFENVSDIPSDILAFVEATIGLILCALLISYLPTMYSAFARREAAVSMLEVRAGTPPSAVQMIVRYQRISGLDQISELWQSWEVWFAEIEESHTSLAALSFFRSPQPQRSWVTASGTVLDAAALVLSSVDRPPDARAALCIRAGFLALRHIASFFRVPYPPDPHFPDQPISIARAEFDAAYDELAAAGVPMKPDRDKAWLNYAGWRVNYDIVLLVLAELTVAPAAPWSSDRAVPRQYTPFAQNNGRRRLY